MGDECAGEWRGVFLPAFLFHINDGNAWQARTRHGKDAHGGVGAVGDTRCGRCENECGAVRCGEVACDGACIKEWVVLPLFVGVVVRFVDDDGTECVKWQKNSATCADDEADGAGADAFPDAIVCAFAEFSVDNGNGRAREKSREK